MIHLPALIVDLGLILGAAGIITLLFKKLKQPLVLGYILAGLLVGPNTPFLPTISDVKGINIWAEIGVIFLLFSLGLEFSFKKLMKVGGPASVTAIIEVTSMLVIGYITGQFLGWSTMDSVFLGGILSISSTTIIIRAFDELNVKSKKFVGLVFGILIVEDLVAVLLLVLLSTLAVSRQFSGMEMLISVVKLSFFLILWFLAGIFLLPSFLKRTRKLMNDETLLIVSVSLCLLMVLLATKAGFSAALGAFIMGSILAETTHAEKIETLIKSVRDLFGAIFFVSVGMLIDPSIVVDYWKPIIIITAIFFISKAFSTTLGAVASGQPIKTSVQAGMSVTQIGEFSFIIATLGVTLKVTSPFLYPIAVAVSVFTTFTTPYAIRSSESIFKFIESNLPKKWKLVLNRYSTSAQTISTVNDWKIVLRSYMVAIVSHSVIILSIILLSATYAAPIIRDKMVNGSWGHLLSAVTTLIFVSPFLWGLAGRKFHNKSYSNLWLDKKYNRGPLISMELLRVGLAIFFIGFLLNQFFSATIAFVVAMPTTLFLLIVFSNRLQAFYNRIESRFLINLNERDAEKRAMANQQIAPWDAHLAYYEVAPESQMVGQSLVDLGLREKYGVNVALIERGKLKIPAPPRNERLYPGDKISVIGTDEQLTKFGPMVEASNNANSLLFNKPDISLKNVLITSHSPLLSKNLRESGIREKTQGLVVGIERAGVRILNPDSLEEFKEGDIVWIVGNTYMIDLLIKGQLQ